MDPPDSYLKQTKELLFALEEDERHPGASILPGSQGLAPQEFRSTSVSIGGSSGPQSEAGLIIALKDFPNRGTGTIATRPIAAGTLILKEDAILTVRDLPETPLSLESTLALLSAYAKLPTAARQKVMGLFAWNCEDWEKTIRDYLASGSGDFELTDAQLDFVLRLHSVWGTNSFASDDPLFQSLYLEVSRFNHSCIPNCAFSHETKGKNTMTIWSSRDIQPGEELTVAYFDIFKRRLLRQFTTIRNWGFVCSCAACNPADPTVDTAAHEEMIASYRELARESCLTFHTVIRTIPMSVEDLNEALIRSIQRAQIVETMDENELLLQEILISAGICEVSWLRTGDEEYLQRQISFLTKGRPIAWRIRHSTSSRAMGKALVRWLSAARDSPANARRAQLLESEVLPRLGEKFVAANALLAANHCGCMDQEELLDASLQLEDLPTELRAVVAASGHSFEDVLYVAQDIAEDAEMEGEEQSVENFGACI